MSTSDDPPSPGPVPPAGQPGIDAEGGPLVLAGQYLTRCVDPFISVDVLVVTAQQQDDIECAHSALYM
jgi:hypothetical protein